MVDDVAQLDLIDAATPRRAASAPCASASTLDACWRPLGGRVHVGAKRSPLHTPRAGRRAGARDRRAAGLRLVGLMAYEAQIAGRRRPPAGQAAARRSRCARCRRARRASWPSAARAIVAAVEAVAPLRVRQRRRHRQPGADRRRAGGHRDRRRLRAARADAVRRLRAFAPRPAALFALPVVRRPGAAASSTALGGGYLASGAGRPRPAAAARACPPGCGSTRSEGAGEVQTPLLGPRPTRPARRRPRLVPPREGRRAVRALRRAAPRSRATAVVETVPTYRGEEGSASCSCVKLHLSALHMTDTYHLIR